MPNKDLNVEFTTRRKPNKIDRLNIWGYIFLLPFTIVFIVFQLIPLVNTIYNSFFENYMAGLKQVGPNFVGLGNFKELMTGGDLTKYFGNTMIMWILGFIPQIVLSLLLSSWFTNPSLRLKFQRFFKTVIYLPNLIMASAFAMLFFTMFDITGPVNSLLVKMHLIDQPFSFFTSVGATRGLVAFMNCLMWFGNTTILLMAGMLGIPVDIFEAADVDGATPTQVFWKITLPLLRPILVYVMVTSLIGGLQMFDVPQILTNGKGDPMRTSMTLIMYLNKHLYSKNYGLAGALSVLLLIITAILSFVVFKITGEEELNRKTR
ncbi:MAG: sugar ABC transporter permease [Oscillospiraceae bacterium]|nr:sugar ABC transporter permease [Oscillospiraceae bacterium]